MIKRIPVIIKGSFIIIVTGLVVFWGTREFLPRVVDREVERIVEEYVPSTIMERSVTGRVEVSWPKKVFTWATTKEEQPEKIIEYKEQVLDSLITTSLLYMKLKAPRLIFDVYKSAGLYGTIKTHNYDNIEKEFELFIDQETGEITLIRPRNLLDRPTLEVGVHNTGAHIQAEMRVWKFYPQIRATEEGVSYGVAIRF